MTFPRYRCQHRNIGVVHKVVTFINLFGTSVPDTITADLAIKTCWRARLGEAVSSGAPSSSEEPIVRRRFREVAGARKILDEHPAACRFTRQEQ